MGDAFTNDMKQQVVAAIKADLGQIDLVVYSLAAPRRTHPTTGVVHKSCLKPLGAPYTNKTVDTDKGIVSEVTIDPASEAEVADTVAVMGGEDWELWIKALRDAKLLAPGATSVAYSYIGPEVTWADLQERHHRPRQERPRARRPRHRRQAQAHGGGRAFISVNKALVTQASSAIPVVPLYISILYKIMKAAGTHEGCIEQMQRLFATQMYNGHTPNFDEPAASASTTGKCAPRSRPPSPRSGPRSRPRISPRSPTSPATARSSSSSSASASGRELRRRDRAAPADDDGRGPRQRRPGDVDHRFEDTRLGQTGFHRRHPRLNPRTRAR
jgi:hypothetical protein